MLFPFLTRVEKNKIPKWWFVVAFFCPYEVERKNVRGEAENRKHIKVVDI